MATATPSRLERLLLAGWRDASPVAREVLAREWPVAGGDGAAQPQDGVGAVAEAIARLGSLDRLLADGAVAPEDLPAVIEGLGHVEAVMTAARARAIAAADEAGLPEVDGAASTGPWVASLLRTTGAAAHREVDLAVDLVGRPDLLSSLATGQISREHAVGVVAELERQRQDQEATRRAERARQEQERREREAADLAAQQEARTLAERARLAEEARQREAAMAERAREAREAQRQADEAAARAREEALRTAAESGATPEQVRWQGREMRAEDVATMERDAQVQHHRRAVRHWHKDGMHHILLVLGDEAWERAKAAEAAAITLDPKETPEDERRTPEQRRADAWIDLIDTALGAGALATRRGVKPHLTVVAPAATLVGDDQPGHGEAGSLLSPETVRRLACDAGLTRAVVDATSQVIDLGRETNRWSVGAYKAMQAMFDGCVFPVADGQACGRPLDWCDLHHVDWWRHGGRTDLVNAAPACRHHHIEVHHGGWTMTYDPVAGTVTITRDADGHTRTVHVRRDVLALPGTADDQPSLLDPETAYDTGPTDDTDTTGPTDEAADRQPD